MTPSLSAQDLAEAQDLLTALSTEVEEQESTLAGGTKLGLGGTALQALRDTRVTFGNPANHLIRLTPALFEAVGVEVNEIWRRQMRTQFDFYYLTLTVSLQPGRGTQFRRLECSLDFGPKGSDEVIVQRLFPTSSWKEILSAGGAITLALDGKLDWSVGLAQPAAFNLANVPAEVQAQVANTNALNAFVTLPSYTFTLGRTEIAATGEGNSTCFWRLEPVNVRETHSVQFALVFKVPQGTRSITLTGLVAVEPEMRWLRSCVRGVAAFLSHPLRALLQQPDEERSGKARLPLGDHEEWTLTLPR